MQHAQEKAKEEIFKNIKTLITDDVAIFTR